MLSSCLDDDNNNNNNHNNNNNDNKVPTQLPSQWRIEQLDLKLHYNNNFLNLIL